MGSHKLKVGHLPTPILTITNVSGSVISLAWSLPRAYSGVASYIVERGTNGTSFPNTVYSGLGLSVNDIVTWSSGVPFYYRVRFLSTSGRYSSYSSTQSRVRYAPVWNSAPATLQFQSQGGTHNFSVYVTDVDAGDTFTYTLPSKYRPDITIGSTTGILSVPSAAANSSGNVTVRVMDSHGMTADTVVGVTVLPVANLPPVWATVPSLTISQGSSLSVASYASDPEGATLTFSRQGGTAPVGVTVSSVGLISVTSGTALGAYTVIVRAVDPAGLYTDKTINLTVQAVSSAISNFSGGPLWPSGYCQIGTAGGAPEWEAWMGRTGDVASCFSSPATNWTGFMTGKTDAGANFSYLLTYAPITRTIVHVYPMFPTWNNTSAIGVTGGTNLSNKNNARPTTFHEIANTTMYDNYYLTAAQNMRQLIVNSGRDINSNNGNVIINLAHEMNGSWYDFFVGTAAANWILAWRKIVTIWRSVMPGLRFEWRPARSDSTATYNGGVRVNPTAYWPGAAYVDFVGRSLHDNEYKVDGAATAITTIDENSWQKIHVVPQDTVRAVGLTEMLNIAINNGKKFCFTEWGAQMIAISGHPQSQKASMFIQKAYEWMYANRAHMAWDTYFSSSDAQLHGTGSYLDPETGTTGPRRNSLAAQAYHSSLRWGAL